MGTEIKRQNGYGGCCNYVVQDLENDIVHFMSRIVGISKCCMMELDKKVTKFRYHGKINKNTGGPFFGYDKRDVYHYERDDEIETLKHGNKKNQDANLYYNQKDNNNNNNNNNRHRNIRDNTKTKKK